MKILVVAPQPVFTPRGTPFSVYHRLAVTLELGLEAHLLTYAEGADPDLPGLTIHRIPRLPFLGPVKVGPSFGKLVRDVLMVLWTVRLLVALRPDVVHAHEEAVFWCRLLKPIFGFRLVYDMHSSLPQQLVNFDFSSSRILIGLFERLEASALEGADAVLTISPDLARFACERIPDPSRHVLLENSLMDPVRLESGALDGRRREPAEAKPVWPEEWAGSHVVLYAGTLEPYQGVDLLLEAFTRVARARPDARLLILGGSEDQVEAYREMAMRLGLDDVTHLPGQVPQATVRELMQRAAVLVTPRVRGVNTPSKVYEMMLSGVPFVATRIRAHTQVLDDSVCGLAEPEPEALAEAIVATLDGGRVVAERVERARRSYHEKYSRSSYRSRLAGALGLRTSAREEATPPAPDRRSG